MNESILALPWLNSWTAPFLLSPERNLQDYIALCNDFDVTCPSQGKATPVGCEFLQMFTNPCLTGLCYKNFESFVDDTTSQAERPTGKGFLAGLDRK